jgi:acyl carrier protein
MEDQTIDLIKEKCRRSEILPDDHLVNDLNLNSLDIVEIVVEMEQRFNITIPDEKAELVCCVRDLILLSASTAKKALK